MVQLYIWDSCPFCQKVLRAAQQLGLKEGEDYQIVDSAPGTRGRDVVEKTGGKDMVPFLIDDDTWMYESDDIIDYLHEKFSK